MTSASYTASRIFVSSVVGIHYTPKYFVNHHSYIFIYIIQYLRINKILFKKNSRLYKSI